MRTWPGTKAWIVAISHGDDQMGLHGAVAFQPCGCLSTAFQANMGKLETPTGFVVCGRSSLPRLRGHTTRYDEIESLEIRAPGFGFVRKVVTTREEHGGGIDLPLPVSTTSCARDNFKTGIGSSRRIQHAVSVPFEHGMLKIVQSISDAPLSLNTIIIIITITRQLCSTVED